MRGCMNGRGSQDSRNVSLMQALMHIYDAGAYMMQVFMHIYDAGAYMMQVLMHIYDAGAYMMQVLLFLLDAYLCHSVSMVQALCIRNAGVVY